MPGNDVSFVVCSALSAAGLAIALLTAWKKTRTGRHFRRATAIAGWALVPIGLHLTGLVGVFGTIGVEFGKWAAKLVFSMQVWTGFAVLAVGVLLMAIARLTGGRGRKAKRGKGKSKGVDAGTAAGPAAPEASKPAGALPAEKRAAQPASGSKSSGDGEGEDFSEIEEILKRRGI